ncbi:MAG: long-chain acyl-CoA synthetase [Planctomycetota bacterium]|jgi:long-chain acyl-CoA synthetase
MTGISSKLIRCFEKSANSRLLIGNQLCVRESWNGAEIIKAVKDLAAGLTTLGIEARSHIGLISDNFDLWLIADLGSLHAGLVNVPRARDTSAEEVAFVLGHSGCRAAFLEDKKLLSRLAPELENLAEIETIIVLRGDTGEISVPGKEILTLEEVQRRGQEEVAQEAAEKRARDIDHQDLATIVYTSGTTGNPKGVRLTHGNILHNIRTVPIVIDLRTDDRYLSFLPTWHSFERALEYCLLAAGTSIQYSSKSKLRKDMPTAKPTIMAGVPRLWESLTANVMGSVEKLPTAKRTFVRFALDGSKRCVQSRRLLAGQLVDDQNRVIHITGLRRLLSSLNAFLCSPLHKLADKLVYTKLRAVLGNSIRFVVSGGGALQSHVDEFFNRAGVCLINGYGLTETAPVICIRTPTDNVLTTAGKRLPETEWRVRDENNTVTLPVGTKGVLWVQGPQIMNGYHRNQEATDAVLQGDWFCTGDLAALTQDGEVIIQGRAKDTIVLRGGENVEPELIEAPIAKIPYVQDVLVVGHGEKYLCALLVPNPETLATRFPNLDKDDLSGAAKNQEIGTFLHEAVKKSLSRDEGYLVFQQVPKIICLDAPFSAEDGTLTQTMKKRRPQIEAKHADAIAAAYKDGSPPVHLAH